MSKCVYRGVQYETPKMDAGLIQYFMNRKAKAQASAKELKRDQDQRRKEQVIVQSNLKNICIGLMDQCNELHHSSYIDPPL